MAITAHVARVSVRDAGVLLAYVRSTRKEMKEIGILSEAPRAGCDSAGIRSKYIDERRSSADNSQVHGVQYCIIPGSIKRPWALKEIYLAS